MRNLSEKLRETTELVQGRARTSASRACRGFEAVIDVIVDQHRLGVRDCFLDGMELLRQLDARPFCHDHGYDRAQMAFGPLKASDDVGMGLMQGCHESVRSGIILSSWIG